MKDLEDKYSDELLKILTCGLGASLGKPIRIRYYELKKMLFQNDYAEVMLDRENVQIAVDMIALSVYYQYLIVPFYGSDNFLKNLTTRGVTSIAMGQYSLGSEERQRIEKCTKAFYVVMKKIGLSPSNLAISDTRDILSVINKKEETFEEEDND